MLGERFLPSQWGRTKSKVKGPTQPAIISRNAPARGPRWAGGSKGAGSPLSTTERALPLPVDAKLRSMGQVHRQEF